MNLEAMISTLVDRRGETLSRLDAFMILRRAGYSTADVAANADDAIRYAEIFNEKHCKPKNAVDTATDRH